MQEMTSVRETLWEYYDIILTSYNYYVSLGGVCEEPDSMSFQLGRCSSVVCCFQRIRQWTQKDVRTLCFVGQNQVLLYTRTQT